MPYLVLSKTEFKVVNLVANGLSDKEIASILYMNRRTVSWYISSAFRKMKVDSRTKLMIRLREVRIKPKITESDLINSSTYRTHAAQKSATAMGG